MNVIIITGGAGFIGSNFIASYMSKYKGKIVVCDIFHSDDKWQNVKNHLVYDFVTPTELPVYLKNNAQEIEIVIHLGAISTTTETNIESIVDNNFKFSTMIFDWCTQNHKRLIYASSAATYGDGAQGFIDGDDPNLLQGYKPLNAYAWSKHAFDRKVAYLKYNDYNLPSQIVGLKFFNVYGPNEYHKGNQMSVAWRAYQQIKQNLPVTLFKSMHQDYKDGEQLRDFIYVNDCCHVMEWFIANKSISGLFNVGTGQSRTFNDLAKSVCTAVGMAENIQYIDLPPALHTKYQYYTEADLANLRAAGYDKEFISLEDGVKDYVQLYLNKDDSYR